VLVIVGVLVLAFVVARGCQQSQVRVSKEQAIATAKREVDFTARRTNVRLLRQGVNSKPYWFVNLSVPGQAPGSIRRLSVVKIDANNGKVVEVDKQR
jgi:NAD(P)H-flavin reductase